MSRRRQVARAVAAALAVCCAGAGPVYGSGAPEPSPLYLSRTGGTAAELARLHEGRVGIILTRAPNPLLYLHWRQLHGLRVGRQAGETLTDPCCQAYDPDPAPYGEYAWLQARRDALGAAPGTEPFYVAMDRRGPNYSAIPNCFADAFETAAATLRERVARFGAAAPAVRAWLQTQDAVFGACARPDTALPPPLADAPQWLSADRAYQEAAFALYNFRTGEAAERFAAIGRDRASPWRTRALYLRARAFHREALMLSRTLAETPREGETLLGTIQLMAERQLLAARLPAAFARARTVIAELSAGPAETFGRGEARKMLRALAFRDRPGELLAELDRELNQAAPAADLELSLRDYLLLARRSAERPDAADWILTLNVDDRGQALTHARDRWRQSGDVAWLVAALSLVNPGEESAAALAADAARVAPGTPAWPTAQYHLVRLTIATADPATTRARLDGLLALPGLTLTERNLVSSARAQVATDLGEFARLAVREPYCLAVYNDCEDDEYWHARTLGRRAGTGGWVGLGEEARAIVDRMPLQQRMALSRVPELPQALRLDVALTSFARAVQLRDDRAIDAMAADLVTLLPQLRSEWQTISATRPGPAKRFATFFAMAKIPGLRTDLTDYVRPHGTVAQFQREWVAWRLLPPDREPPAAQPPVPQLYWDGYWLSTGEGQIDLICLGKCGLASFPLRLPPFVAAGQDQAQRERGFFRAARRYDPESDPAPPGTVYLWDEALAYAEANPRDARSPEMLYWLIRIARWGGNHDHLGRRAFRLLHRRYPGTAWARRSPIYWD